MTSFLYGMLGGVVANVALVVALILSGPRLMRASMKKALGGGFGKKPAGVALAEQYAPKGEA